MASYLSSYVQKKFLKYALSRVGLVDTEALDLDNLGIQFGQRSTAEVRDIGLKLEVRHFRSCGGANNPENPPTRATRFIRQILTFRSFE